MLYESDINRLLTQWESDLDKHSPDYKLAIRDCIYDIKCLIDKQFAEEALAEESFEQQFAEMEKDPKFWSTYYEQMFNCNGLLTF